MVEAAKIVEEAKPDILDINFGCPVKKVAGTSVVSRYLQLNGSKKPEIVTSSTYNLTNYNEAARVLQNTEEIIRDAEKYKEILPEEAQASYYQLVYYPAAASANIHRMQIYMGLNKAHAKQKRASANLYAGLVEQ